MHLPRSYHPYIFPTTPTPIVYMRDVNSGSVCVANEYIGGCGR